MFAHPHGAHLHTRPLAINPDQDLDQLRIHIWMCTKSKILGYEFYVNPDLHRDPLPFTFSKMDIVTVHINVEHSDMISERSDTL